MNVMKQDLTPMIAAGGTTSGKPTASEMAAASAHPIPCMFNTQRELNLKHVYKTTFLALRNWPKCISLIFLLVGLNSELFAICEAEKDLFFKEIGYSNSHPSYKSLMDEFSEWQEHTKRFYANASASQKSDARKEFEKEDQELLDAIRAKSGPRGGLVRLVGPYQSAVRRCLARSGLAGGQPPESSRLVSATSLNWPSGGGIEDWGFSRPSGCQSGDAYIAPLARRFQSTYLTRPWVGSESTSRQYVNGSQTNSFIDKIKRGGLSSQEGQALTKLVNDLNDRDKRFQSTANDYLKLIAGGGTSSSVVRRIRNFELSDNSCSVGGQSPSASGSIICGLAAQMIAHTIELENAIQIACHAGLPMPSFRGASGSTESQSSRNDQQFRDGQSRSDQSQQPSQQAQQQAQQAQEAARVAQTRADQARQGQRKTHDPAAEAHECVALDNAGSGNFGAFKNTCGFRVNFYTCNYRPRITQDGFNWSADFDCDKQQMGMHTPGGGVSVAAHNRNTETVHWFACKAPATPVDVSFVQGQGLSGRCN